MRRINETTAGKYNGKHLLRHLFLSSHAGEANPLQTNVAVLFLSESDRVILQRFLFFFMFYFLCNENHLLLFQPGEPLRPNKDDLLA